MVKPNCRKNQSGLGSNKKENPLCSQTRRINYTETYMDKPILDREKLAILE
jgi:hypothetical protein